MKKCGLALASIEICHLYGDRFHKYMSNCISANVNWFLSSQWSQPVGWKIWCLPLPICSLYWRVLSLSWLWFVIVLLKLSLTCHCLHLLFIGCCLFCASACAISFIIIGSKHGRPENDNKAARCPREWMLGVNQGSCQAIRFICPF